MLKHINLNYIIAVPLIVMSYHIYNFYESEPAPVRIALAISFDLMVVVCFYLLKDPLIAKKTNARKATWSVLMILIAFQLFVNVWAYWDLHWARAFLSGSIFPVTVALISYIGMLREGELEKQEAKKETKQIAKEKTEEISSPEDMQVIAASRPWDGLRVPKEEVVKAWGIDPKNGIEIFKGSTNWKSVKRWWAKLQEGETP